MGTVCANGCNNLDALVPTDGNPAKCLGLSAPGFLKPTIPSAPKALDALKSVKSLKSPEPTVTTRSSSLCCSEAKRRITNIS
jgi:hypothetical protein